MAALIHVTVACCLGAGCLHDCPDNYCRGLGADIKAAKIQCSIVVSAISLITSFLLQNLHKEQPRTLQSRLYFPQRQCLSLSTSPCHPLLDHRAITLFSSLFFDLQTATRYLSTTTWRPQHSPTALTTLKKLLRCHVLLCQGSVMEATSSSELIFGRETS